MVGKGDKSVLEMRPKPCGQAWYAGELVQLREEGTLRMGFDGWVGVFQVEKSRRKCQVGETGGAKIQRHAGGHEWDSCVCVGGALHLVWLQGAALFLNPLWSYFSPVTITFLHTANVCSL